MIRAAAGQTFRPAIVRHRLPPVVSFTAPFAAAAAVEPTKVEYVHPLSQLALKRLTSPQCHDWVERNQLEKSLQLQPDGTFILAGTIKIWTYFDRTEKKHLLCCRKGDLVGKFLLQDNLKSAWNDGRSTPEKVHSAVDAMIEKIGGE